MLSAAIIDDPDWGFVPDLLPGGHVAAFLSPFDAVWAREHLELRDTLWVALPGPRGQPVFLYRKPLEGTVVENVLKHGTGAINIDATRVEHADPADFEKHKTMVDRLKAEGGSLGNSWKNSSDLSGASEVSALGRWPTNLLLIHAPECRCTGTKKVKNVGGTKRGSHWLEWRRPDGDAFGTLPNRVHDIKRNRDEDGNETVTQWECAPGCPVPLLDAQSDNRPGMSGGGLHREDYGGGLFGGINCAHTARGDSGGASRFFPQLQGIDELVNWLTRLIVPPGGQFLVRLSK